MSPAALSLFCILSTPVRIAVIGDRTGGSNDSEFVASLEAAMLLRPDIVVNVGDFIEGYSDDPDQLDSEWDHILGIVDGFLGNTPLVLVPGNHDITYDVAEEVWRERTSTEPSRVARVGGVEFVIWDTSRMAWPDSAEIEGLRDLLRGVRRSDTAVLLTHQPFWMMEGDTATAQRIRELAEEYDLEAVIGGHIHTWSSEMVNGVLYASMCTSGGDFGAADVQAGRLTQIGWLTLDGDSAQMAVVDPHGIYASNLNSVEEENLLYRIEGRMLDPNPLEAALESATLSLRSVEEADRVVTITVQPGNWGLMPESLQVELPAGESRNVSFSQNPVGSPWPIPVLSATVQYGPRDKTAVLEIGWPVLRYLWAPAATVAVDGAASPGEYPGRPETEFASADGSAQVPGATLMTVSCDGTRLCVHSAMTLPDGGSLDDEAFAVVICLEDTLFRVKVFPDGGSSAITGGSTGIEPLEAGFDAAAIAREDSWEAEISLDLSALGVTGETIPANFYRLGSNDEVATWAWPLEFEEKHMGIVEIGR
jgi:Icc-related predicted phosphoesterase